MRHLLLVSFLMSGLQGLQAQLPDVRKDSLSHQIPEVEVKSQRAASMLKERGRGRLTWDMDMMNDMPKILGNADPMHYTQMLPGVQTNNEYDSGLHIYGCDNTHNMVSIGGVPIYNASHLLGLFSIFNASHYPTMYMEKTGVDASFPNRLGGMVSMTLPGTLADSVSGACAIGLMSSQGTIKLPIGKKSQLTLSARGCYLNWLYGYALKTDESQLGYTFWDWNATWMYRPDDANTFWVDTYWGGDRANMDERDYQAQMRLKWGNRMMSTHWEHKFDGGGAMKHCLFYTGYECRFQLEQPQLQLRLPSSIDDIGYQGSVKRDGWQAGVTAQWHRIKPQTLILRGAYGSARRHDEIVQQTQEYAAYVSKMVPLGRNVVLDAGLRASLYVDDSKKTYRALDPSVSVLFSQKTWETGLTVSRRHQYIFQTGFSSKGLPTEFWASTDGVNRPQSGLNISGTWARSLFDGRLRLSAEVYLKYLDHQVEYNGSMLNLLMTDYRLDEQLLRGKGRNYGVNLMLAKTAGWLTGWIGYNVGRAERKFDHENLTDWYAANHERIHELNAVAHAHIRKRWMLGATYVYASGTPYTAPEYVYLYSSYLISMYSPHNAYRLKPYSRLDISANYCLRKTQRWESGLNLSVYNVLGRKNELFYTWHTSGEDGFYFGPVSFVLRMMPSISYYAKF